MVANPREVLDTSTANKNDGVLLQIVPDTGDVGSYLNPIRKPDTCYFAQRGVWFLGGRRIDPCANSPALGTPLQSRTLRLETNLLSARLNQLIEGRQPVLSLPAPSATAVNLRHSEISPVEKPDEYSKAPRCCQDHARRKSAVSSALSSSPAPAKRDAGGVASHAAPAQKKSFAQRRGFAVEEDGSGS
jgi:hypothetical protein